MLRDDLLDLNDVLQHPGRQLAVDISTELPEEEDLDLAEPIEGFLEAVSTGNMLLISGKFKAKVVIECSRCTGPIETEIDFELDEQFPVEGVASSLSHTEQAKVAPDEPYPLFEGNSLMVEALLRQTLLINLPYQTLCSFGWDGDCPVAKERNAGIELGKGTSGAFADLQNLLKSEEKD